VNSRILRIHQGGKQKQVFWAHHLVVRVSSYTVNRASFADKVSLVGSNQPFLFFFSASTKHAAGHVAALQTEYSPSRLSLTFFSATRMQVRDFRTGEHLLSGALRSNRPAGGARSSGCPSCYPALKKIVRSVSDPKSVRENRSEVLFLPLVGGAAAWADCETLQGFLLSFLFLFLQTR
jgi:hypothetical protein